MTCRKQAFCRLHRSRKFAPIEEVHYVTVSLAGGDHADASFEDFVKDGKKQFAMLPYEEFVSLKERLEDMEDLLDLRKAKKAEGRKRSVPLTGVKRQLGLK